ncbi:MAG: hypothetical protein IPM97_14570 [Bdellovibrionaceae bacterium]|nr:hypothetical protein [Pseudobdellovibrionaceae bacterium]
MKNLFVLALLLLLSQSGIAVNSKSKSPAKSNGTKLGTSFRFDGSSLRGKYQTSLSTTATVENDKYLEDILQGRKEFTDRQKADQNRN